MATPVPFKRDEIPYTQARLKSLIKIYATFGGYKPDPNDPTAVPTLASFDVTFTSVMTYQATFLEACGFAGGEIRYQTRPIAFALILPSPTPDTIPNKVLILRGCQLKDNPMKFDVEQKDDLRIIQEVPVACAGIIEV